MEEEVMMLKKGEKTALITTFAKLFLALGKAAVSLLSGSLVLMTDALHSGVDVIPIFASWFGLKISQKEPDEKFPYGYYKAESIATLFISVFILYAAVELALEGYSNLFTIPEVSYTVIASSAAVVSIIVSGWVSRFQKSIGEEINSQALIVNSKESLMDVFSSIVVLIAIVLSYYRVPYVTGVVTIAISILIFKVGLESVKDSSYALMDVSPSKEIEKKIVEIIDGISGVEGFEDLKLRKAGPFIFGECVVKIRKFVDVERAHEISDNLEEKIKDEIEQIEYFTLHIEPRESKKKKIAIPVDNKQGLRSEISDHFGRANYFALVSIDEKEIEDVELKENEFKEKKVRAGLAVSHFIAGEKIDILVTKQIGEISFHVLRDHLVDVYKAEGQRVQEIVDSFVDDKLERLDEPTRQKD